MLIWVTPHDEQLIDRAVSATGLTRTAARQVWR